MLPSNNKKLAIIMIVVAVTSGRATAGSGSSPPQQYLLPLQQQQQQQQGVQLEWQAAATERNGSVVAINGAAVNVAHSNNNNNDNTNSDDEAAANELAVAAAEEEMEEEEKPLGTSSSGEKLLSRKRRYLLFPEGSSFQLVYDGIYGMVDYTNYLILGITVALAWELPTKAPSEMIEDIRGRLANGTFVNIGRRNDTVGNITYTDRRAPYIDAKTYALSNNRYKQYYTNSKHGDKAAAKWAAHFQTPMHGKYNNNNYYYYSKQPTRRKDFYYNNKGYNSKKQQSYRYNPYVAAGSAPHYRRQQQQQQHQPMSAAGGKYPWWRLVKGLSNAPRWQQTGPAGQRRFDQLQSNRSQQQQSGYYQSNAAVPATAAPGGGGAGVGRGTARTPATGGNSRRTTAARKHRIYPIFGKRRRRRRSRRDTTAAAATTVQRDGIEGAACGADERLGKVDRIHIRHHRRSRRSLYDKIEKYLDKRGSHGQHCVLRALCETAQKSAAKQPQPGSFVAEIMRALFTLPEAIDSAEGAAEEHVDERQRRYDAAHAYAGDCAARYQHCKDSLWTSHFLQ